VRLARPPTSAIGLYPHRSERAGAKEIEVTEGTLILRSMEERTLAVRWHIGLHAIVGASCVVPAVVSFAIATSMLDAAESDRVRARAHAALQAVRFERAEGVPIDAAMHHVLVAAQADGTRLLLRGSAVGEPHSNTTPLLPDSLSTLPPGRCAEVSEPASDALRACAVEDGGVEAVVGLSSREHRYLIRRLAALLVLAAAMIGLCAHAALKRVLARAARSNSSPA
jgi:hypothetical protein